jgi:hypothetical protein
MGLVRILLLWFGGTVFSSVLAWSSQAPAPPPPVPLVLAGGTIIDVTDWGRSAKDQPDSIVIVQNGRITDVGTRASIPIPKGARVIDCTGKFIVPGLIDGFAGMSSQGEANANLYMGVTTVVASSDEHRGHVDLSANPTPHVYILDSVGTRDDWSLLISHPEWTEKLRENGHPVELSPEDTARQLADTAKLGTRVVWLGHNLTAANTQWIIAHAHQAGLVTYGEFISTPYKVAIDAGVDALLHMGRYELGVIPDELQLPLVEDPEGSPATTAYDYTEHLPPGDIRMREYAHFLAWHHAALMPTFSLFYLRLPGHRNLWTEPVAKLLDPSHMFNPSDQATGEMVYPLPGWARHLPGMTTRWMQANLQKKADLSAMRLWRIDQTIFAAYPHYLAASGASVFGTMPGVSMHTELEMMVRLGLSAREALATATNNYAIQFSWNDLGQVTPGRRADILVVDADPTVSIWNVRRISTLIVDGNVIDRDALLNLKK